VHLRHAWRRVNEDSKENQGETQDCTLGTDQKEHSPPKVCKTRRIKSPGGRVREDMFDTVLVENSANILDLQPGRLRGCRRYRVVERRREILLFHVF